MLTQGSLLPHDLPSCLAQLWEILAGDDMCFGCGEACGRRLATGAGVGCTFSRSLRLDCAAQSMESDHEKA
jgi:hypothetical protein